jgi:hypothetical protein
MGHPILDLVRAQAVLSAHALEEDGLELVFERGAFHVYRRHGALPPARIVPEAVVVASDEEALTALATDRAAYDRRTLVAPGFEEAVSGAPTVSEFRAGTLRVERPAANRFDVEVEGTSGGWLVMHEQWAPGWRATVDGEDVPLVRADHACRAVRIPAGSSRVETHFAPTSLRLGAGLAVLGLVLALVLDRLAGRPAPAAR